MNAVEIEEAISALAEQPFNGGEFPFAFLQAFGNKETTIKRLRAQVHVLEAEHAEFPEHKIVWEVSCAAPLYLVPLDEEVAHAVVVQRFN